LNHGFCVFADYYCRLTILFRNLNRVFGCFFHTVKHGDAGVVEYSSSLFLVCANKPDYKRLRCLSVIFSFHDCSGDIVTVSDSAENVNQHSTDILV
jgi:hypothetical protein